MSRSRIRSMPPTELEPEARRVHDAIVAGPRGADARLVAADGSLTGPFPSLLLSPAIGDAVQGLGVVLRFGSTLPDDLRELATLVVAAHWRSEFEWEHHEPLARAAGVAPDAIDAVWSGRDPEGCTAAQAAVWAACVVLLRDRRLDDVNYDRLLTVIDQRAALELFVLVGYYGLLAAVMAGFDVC